MPSPRIRASSFSSPENIVACPDCDLLQRVPPLPSRGTARCPRCDRALATRKPDSGDRTLALAAAAAIAFLFANVEPLMRLSVAGRESRTTIAGGAWEMWMQGERITASLVVLFAMIAPALEIGFLVVILLSARRPPAPVWVGTLLRWVKITGFWSMVEVMMLGILVALVKIAALARVVPGIGIFAAGALIVLLAAMSASFDPREVWSRVRWVNGEWPHQSLPRGGADVAEAGAMIGVARTGARAGLVSCGACGLLSRSAGAEEPGHCPRCGEKLGFRRRHAIQRTWAFIIAAAICYLPANILPVMRTTTLTSDEPDTIFSGVVALYMTGTWYLALIVLIASVMIPLAKLAALASLLITVQRGSIRNLRQRARLYRVLGVIGRWSMLDVFVATFVVALIQLQPLMSVAPEPGVLFFAAVVILTIFAAESFDPRLMWDSSQGKWEPDD